MKRILLTVLLLGGLISIHEIAHFAVTKFYGGIVTELSMGFGPTLVSYKPENSITEYRIALIPVLAYVHTPRDYPKSVRETHDFKAYFERYPEKEGELRKHGVLVTELSLTAQMIILLVGPLANLLLSFLLLFAHCYLYSPEEKSLSRAFSDALSKSITFFKNLPSMTGGVIRGIYNTVVPWGKREIGGVVSIFRDIHNSTSSSESGAEKALLTVMVISLNLAFLNLLPFPQLDGGRILFGLLSTGVDALNWPWLNYGYAYFYRILDASSLALFALILIMVMYRDIRQK